MVEDAQASWVSPGYGYLRNKKKCSRARRGGEVRCLLGEGMAAGGVGGRGERGGLPSLMPYHPKALQSDFFASFSPPSQQDGSRLSRATAVGSLGLLRHPRAGACAALSPGPASGAPLEQSRLRCRALGLAGGSSS